MLCLAGHDFTMLCNCHGLRFPSPLAIFHPSPSLALLNSRIRSPFSNGRAVSLFQTRCKSRVLPWNIFGGTYDGNPKSGMPQTWISVRNNRPTKNIGNGNRYETASNPHIFEWIEMKWLHQRTNTPQPSRNFISMCVSSNKFRIHVVTLEKVMSFVFSAKSTLELIVEGCNKSGCGNILGIICWFWELCFSWFFHGFNWRWKRFRWEWVGPAKGVGL